MSVNEEKIELRQKAKERRNTWAKTAGNDSAKNLKKNFLHILENFNFQTGNSIIIAGFWPIADEMDVRPLISELHETGHSIALPVVVGADKPLIFRIWKPEIILEKGDFGTQHPSAEQPEVVPQMMLVPLLAFDAYGQRLGWGGGFYDRTISKFRKKSSVITVGIAYKGQQVDNVPHMATDEPLDWIVTEIDSLMIVKQ